MMSLPVLHGSSRHRWIVALFLLMCTGAGLINGLRQTPTYQAQATYVGSFSSGGSETTTSQNYLDRLEELSVLVFTSCEILESRSVAEAAATSLALPAESLSRYTISCEVRPNTYVLALHVEGPDPASATALANAVGAAGVEEVSILQGEFRLHQLDAAAVDPVAAWPAHARNALLGAGAGLILSGIYTLLRRVLSPTVEAGRVDGKRRPRGAASELKVLVVDDDEPTARMLQSALQHEGYQVQTAHSGRAALKVAGGWMPDLVLLDVMLPDISGFEVCRRLRQSEYISAVSIIMLTAKGQISDKLEAFSAGADDYLVKPVELAELRMRVQAQIRRARMTSGEREIANL